MKMGLEVLLGSKPLLKTLRKKRVGLVCHPASVDQNLNHSLDLLFEQVDITAAFGPQHGVLGEKQDNMIESDDFIHPKYKIPVFSLYGKVRRPTAEMMKSFDVLLFDLQDLGCRIYTFLTTLVYLMEECSKYKKKLLVLDRPNPAGRPVEGFLLEKGWESFVGAGPIPMRHGLTLGEMALYFKDHYKLEVDLEVIRMQSYRGAWPEDRTWINPSPNAGNINMARVYSGSVLLEGTELSEGRGTTRALEVFGAPDLEGEVLLKKINSLEPKWLRGCTLRPCFFQPTFHKHQGQVCGGLHIHADHESYKENLFKPFRLMALAFKSVLKINPEYKLFRDFPYEYETRLAFDVINGGPKLREWITHPKASPQQLEKALSLDEAQWKKTRKKHLLYSPVSGNKI